MDFTFAVLTYNQEKFILQHLESIKYQIMKFGVDINVNLVVSDDGSKDNTIFLVEKWTNENYELFNDIKILKSTVNQGIVHNYIRLLDNIKTEKFKILAGDDIYFKNSIFDYCDKTNFIITPPIFFDEENVVYGDRTQFYEQLYFYAKKKNVKQKLINRYKFGKCFPFTTSGIIFDKELAGEGLYRAISKNKWIEDIPEWHYIINEDKTKVTVGTSPVILYRYTQGVSNNVDNPIYREIHNEGEKSLSERASRLYKLPKVLNPYAYVYFLKNSFIRNYISKTEIIKSFNCEIKREEDLVNNYIKFLNKRVVEFCEEIGYDF